MRRMFVMSLRLIRRPFGKWNGCVCLYSSRAFNGHRNALVICCWWFGGDVVLQSVLCGSRYLKLVIEIFSSNIGNECNRSVVAAVISPQPYHFRPIRALETKPASIYKTSSSSPSSILA